MLSRRAILLLLVAAPLLALSALLPVFVWVAGLYFISAVALIIADMVWDRRSPQFEITRLHDDKLSLSAENPVRLQIRNRAPRSVRYWLRDEPPDQWVDGATLVEGTLAARQTAEQKYTVFPMRRGDYEFGDMTLRRLGPLGLWMGQQTLDKTASVKVYPNLMDVRRYDLLLRRNRLQEIGLRNVRITGEGTEYERLRDYTPDDDFRRIDWNATARRNKPITVEYQTERSQNIIPVIDIGRMMQSPVTVVDSTREIAKLDYVINATLLLSYVATGMGDKVGLMTFADQVETFLAPRQGRGQFLRMLEALYAVNPQPIEPDYGRALAYLGRKQRRRSLVIIFTDVLGGVSLNQLSSSVSLLARRSLPLVVSISDPDIVAASQQVPTDSFEVYQQTAASRLLEERRLTLDNMARRGVQTLDVPANELSLSVIQRYLDIKRSAKL